MREGGCGIAEPALGGQSCQHFDDLNHGVSPLVVSDGK